MERGREEKKEKRRKKVLIFWGVVAAEPYLFETTPHDPRGAACALNAIRPRHLYLLCSVSLVRLCSSVFGSVAECLLRELNSFILLSGVEGGVPRKSHCMFGVFLPMQISVGIAGAGIMLMPIFPFFLPFLQLLQA